MSVWYGRQNGVGMDWDTAIDLYLLHHEANGRSPRTVAWHRHMLVAFAAWCSERDLDVPGTLTPAHMTAWLAWLRSRPNARGGVLKPGAVWSMVCSVRAFLAWCVEDELLDANPARRLRVMKDRPAPKPFTDEELAALWRVVARLPGARGARYRALVAFLVDTGARAGEVCALRPENIDWTSRMALVRGKTGEHMVAFGPRATALLRRWSLLRSPTCPSFFQTSRSATWTPNGLLHLVKRLGERAGVLNAHPHRFRATFATRMCATGNLFAVQAQLGHTTLDMTRRYAAVSGATIRALHDQVGPLESITRNSAGTPRRAP